MTNEPAKPDSKRPTDARNDFSGLAGTYERPYEINPVNGFERSLRGLIKGDYLAIITPLWLDLA
jgi:hypothetical protein